MTPTGRGSRGETDGSAVSRRRRWPESSKLSQQSSFHFVLERSHKPRTSWPDAHGGRFCTTVRTAEERRNRTHVARMSSPFQFGMSAERQETREKVTGNEDMGA
jgi:hypothetical protein